MLHILKDTEPCEIDIIGPFFKQGLWGSEKVGDGVAETACPLLGSWNPVLSNLIVSLLQVTKSN
jgi:hypothetical protein